jgi:hypothetical protein
MKMLSKIRDPEKIIPDPGSLGSKKGWIQDPDPRHCLQQNIFLDFYECWMGRKLARAELSG